MTLLHWQATAHKLKIRSLKPKINSYLIQLHGLGSHGPRDPYFKRQIHGPHFLFISWDHNLWHHQHQHQHIDRAQAINQSSQPILSLIFMESGFSNKSLYLPKMTTKPKVRYLIFSLWSKLMSLFREILGVVIWKAKRYV